MSRSAWVSPPISFGFRFLRWLGFRNRASAHGWKRKKSFLTNDRRYAFYIMSMKIYGLYWSLDVTQFNTNFSNKQSYFIKYVFFTKRSSLIQLKSMWLNMIGEFDFEGSMWLDLIQNSGIVSNWFTLKFRNDFDTLQMFI